MHTPSQRRQTRTSVTPPCAVCGLSVNRIAVSDPPERRSLAGFAAKQVAGCLPLLASGQVSDRMSKGTKPWRQRMSDLGVAASAGHFVRLPANQPLKIVVYGVPKSHLRQSD